MIRSSRIRSIGVLVGVAVVTVVVVVVVKVVEEIWEGVVGTSSSSIVSGSNSTTLIQSCSSGLGCQDALLFAPDFSSPSHNFE